MATKKSQRIGIWVIAIAMLVGTIGGFLVMVLAPQNQAADQARLDKLSAEYQAELEEYQAKVEQRDKKMIDELSPKYFDDFKSYKSRIGSFKTDGIDELKKNDLKAGSGTSINDDTKFAVFYMGWNGEGKMFDSSFNDDESGLGAPLIHEGNGVWTFPGGQQGGVIDGWNEGVKGMKIGGVRELTIPSDMAYGSSGQGEDIKPDSPLKFVMMAVPAPDTGEEVERPKMSEEYKKLYSRLNNIDPSFLEGM